MRTRLSFVIVSLAALTGCAAEPGTETGSDSDLPSGGKTDSPWEEGIPGGWEAIAERCAPPAADEPILYATEFHWWYTREEMAARFAEVYASGMRLFDRAYYEAESGQLILPHVPAWGGRVVLSRRLVENVSRHISKALELRYAEAVFFPDMGHSHFFIPEAHWQEQYAGTEVSEISNMYSRLIDDPELMILYHTAEQLRTHDDEGEILPDREPQWRYFTRNPVGDNKGLGRIDIHRDLESAGNTVRDYEGHKYYGAGFNVSASKDGCFPYLHRGEVYYFDLSLSDLPYPNGGGG